MNYIKLLPLLALVVFGFNAKAQKDTSSPASKNKINVFGSDSVNVFGGYKSKSKNSPIKNIIKFNPLLFINGDIPIYYERVVNKFMTFEVAPGLTYHDFWGDIYNEAQTDTFFTLPYEPNTQYKVGYSFKADVKFFPGKDNLLDGFYLSPEVGYRHYSANYANYDSSGNLLSTYLPGHTNVLDFKAIVGHEYESDNVDDFMWDIYVGLGVRYISAVYYEEGQGPNAFNAYGYSYQTYDTRMKTLSEWMPTVYLGVKIGIGVK